MFNLFIDIFHINSQEFTKIFCQLNQDCPNILPKYQTLLSKKFAIPMLFVPHECHFNSQDYFNINVDDDFNKPFLNLKNSIPKWEDDQYNSDHVFQRGLQLLVDLPYFFLSDKKALLNNTYLKVPPIDMGSAEGTGMLEHVIREYFNFLQQTAYFEPDHNFALPNNQGTEPDYIENQKIISYGLGVVILKCFLSNLKIEISHNLHFWVYEALRCGFTKKYIKKKSPENLVHESLLYDGNLTSAMLNEGSEPDKEELLRENLIFCGNRADYLIALHDGFKLKFRPDILPAKLEKNISLLRSKLEKSNFYESFKKLNLFALMKIMSPIKELSLDFYKNLFEVEFYESIVTNNKADGKDQRLQENSQNMKEFNEAKQIFYQALEKWYYESAKNETDTLRKFFLLTTGSDIFTTWGTVKYTVAISRYSFDGMNYIKCENRIQSWTCDHLILLSPFQTVEAFEEQVLRNYSHLDNSILVD